VAGGSSGVGFAIASALGRDGYDLTLCGRRADKLDRAAERLRADGARVNAVAANLVEEAAIVRLVAAHRERYRRLDVLVNSVGYGGRRGPIEGDRTRRIDTLIAVNVRAAFLLMRECTALLREAGGEHGKALVANVASTAAKRGMDQIAAYSASKAALVALCQAAQAELGASGVQVTALCPALVETPMSQGIEGVDPADMLRPDDLAEAVRFLLRTSSSCLVPELLLVRPAGWV